MENSTYLFDFSNVQSPNPNTDGVSTGVTNMVHYKTVVEYPWLRGTPV